MWLKRASLQFQLLAKMAYHYLDCSEAFFPNFLKFNYIVNDKENLWLLNYTALKIILKD